jgi:hypothetical protein
MSGIRTLIRGARHSVATAPPRRAHAARLRPHRPIGPGVASKRRASEVAPVSEAFFTRRQRPRPAPTQATSGAAVGYKRSGRSLQTEWLKHPAPLENLREGRKLARKLKRTRLGILRSQILNKQSKILPPSAQRSLRKIQASAFSACSAVSARLVGLRRRLG